MTSIDFNVQIVEEGGDMMSFVISRNEVVLGRLSIRVALKSNQVLLREGRDAFAALFLSALDAALNVGQESGGRHLRALPY